MRLARGVSISALLLLIVSISAQYILPASAQYPRDQTIYIPTGGVSGRFFPLFIWGAKDPGTYFMYPTLAVYDVATGTYLPYLAESIYWVGKYTLEVKLRSQARWWDGVPITADDVKYTYELGKRSGEGWWKFMWGYLDRVEVVDARTVRFVGNSSNFNPIFMLIALRTAILPKHRWEQLESQWGARLFTDFNDNEPDKIIGGGPYRLLTYTVDAIVYVRVEDWWGKDVFGLPAPKYIVYKVYKDPATAQLAFEKGEIDIIGTPKNVWEYWTVKNLPRYSISIKPPYGIPINFRWLTINYKSPGLDNPVVRKAIGYAIPYDEIISKAWGNMSIRAPPVPIVESPITQGFIAWDIIEKYLDGDRYFRYDPDKANRILDQAGIVKGPDGIRRLPDGTKLGPYTILVPSGATDLITAAELISRELNRLGIKVEPEVVDGAVGGDRVKKLQYDFSLFWTAAAPLLGSPQQTLWNAFATTIDQKRLGSVYTPCGYSPPYLDEISRLVDNIVNNPFDIKLINESARKLQEYWIKDVFEIPLGYGVGSETFNYDYWTGWPNIDQGRSPYEGWWWGWGGTDAEYVFMFFHIAPKGQTPVVPRWLKEWPIPEMKLLEGLAPFWVTATAPAPTTVTITQTVPVTQAVPTTVVRTQTLTTTTTEVRIDVGITAIAAIITLIVGLAIGWFIFRRR